eukprot:1178120-Amorphochlora_amoeboformis.AAC.1
MEVKSGLAKGSKPFAVYDYLYLAENPRIKKMLLKNGKGDETLHFSDHVTKVSATPGDSEFGLFHLCVSLYSDT